MPYLYHTEEEVKQMLERLGLDSVEEELLARWFPDPGRLLVGGCAAGRIPAPQTGKEGGSRLFVKAMRGASARPLHSTNLQQYR